MPPDGDQRRPDRHHLVLVMNHGNGMGSSTCIGHGRVQDVLKALQNGGISVAGLTGGPVIGVSVVMLKEEEWSDYLAAVKGLGGGSMN